MVAVERHGVVKHPRFKFEETSDVILLRCVNGIRAHTEKWAKCEAKFDDILKMVRESFLLAFLEKCRKHLSKRL